MRLLQLNGYMYTLSNTRLTQTTEKIKTKRQQQGYTYKIQKHSLHLSTETKLRQRLELPLLMELVQTLGLTSNMQLRFTLGIKRVNTVSTSRHKRY